MCWPAEFVTTNQSSGGISASLGTGGSEYFIRAAVVYMRQLERAEVVL
jgi:hypothetical protein